MPDTILPLGRVVATELKPSTPHQFHFWTARDTPIGIGAIVRVEEAGRVVFGVVTDGFAYSDLVTPMHAVLGADGDPVAAGLEPSQRAEIRLFTAAVLRQMPEEPLQPVPLGPVRLATDDGCPARAPDGWLHRWRPPDRHPGWTLCGGRAGVAGVPRLRLSARPRGGASQHHRRLRTRDQDQRRRVPPHQHLPDVSRAQGQCGGALLQREGPGPLLPRSGGHAERRGPPAVRPPRPAAGAVRGRALLRAVQGRRRQPEYAAHQRGALGQHAPARLGPARGARLRRGGSQPRRRGRQGRRLHRFSRRAGGGARVSGRDAARQGRFRYRASRTWRSSSARSSISWRCSGRAARCGGPTTSRPSARSGTA